MRKLNLVKKIIAVTALIICLLGLFKVINPAIGVNIVLIILGMIVGIEAVLDFKKDKKLWMWIDIAVAAVLVILALDKLFGIFRFL